ncbi:MAG: DedA family protein [Sulfurovaceae bacterium]|nr:DedA family protein [Sulfurovaceae bacterium]MDD5548319.1 DedA family protein [Sulfurovaceae bacterium]
MMHDIAIWIVELIGGVGYFGIFILMFLESTFIPIPSEVVMIPAGYLAYKGEMNFFIATLMGTLGSLCGALFNYFFALKFGRVFLQKYGKYILFPHKKQEKLEHFFLHHGEISTFSGRLILGVRHLISLPAGYAKMNLVKFVIYTTLGSFTWVLVLMFVGYFVGSNEALVKHYLSIATVVAAITIILIAMVYVYKLKKDVDKEK